MKYNYLPDRGIRNEKTLETAQIKNTKKNIEIKNTQCDKWKFKVNI